MNSCRRFAVSILAATLSAVAGCGTKPPVLTELPRPQSPYRSLLSKR